MAQKPIFVATHPRACSTAFERVFMTQRDTLDCVHEPFGDAFYFGPERLGERYMHDEKKRVASGFSDLTFQAVFDGLDKAIAKGKRLFIKDMASTIVPPEGKPAAIAPSLGRLKRGVGTNSTNTGDTNHTQIHPYPYDTEAEPNNPTVVPKEILEKFHITFLIRHPRSGIPSYYRCCIPPLDEKTGFRGFLPSEAGYAELRWLFDYLRLTGQIGPDVAGQSKTANGHTGINGRSSGVQICVVDADDLLDNPSGIVKAFCMSVGLEYSPGMLDWSEEDQEHAIEVFSKWNGFHEDAIHSTSLKPRTHKKKVKSEQEEDAEWSGKYGEEGAKVIRETVNANVADYEYLKQFALQV